MRIMTTGGRNVSAIRLDYVKYKKVSFEEGKRELFTAEKDVVEKREGYAELGDTRGAQKNCFEIVASLSDEQLFIRMGETRAERLETLRKVTRTALATFFNEAGIQPLKWVAGIHTNTDNPHVHIVLKHSSESLNPANQLYAKFLRAQPGKTNGITEIFEAALRDLNLPFPVVNVPTRIRLGAETANEPATPPPIEDTEGGYKLYQGALNYLLRQKSFDEEVVNDLLFHGNAYVSRQGQWVFFQRNPAGFITGYTQNGSATPDKEGFYFVGDPRQARRIVITSEPLEAISLMQLAAARDLSETCFIALPAQNTAAVARAVAERAVKSDLLLVWAYGYDRAGEQHPALLETFKSEVRRGAREMTAAGSAMHRIKLIEYAPGKAETWQKKWQIKVARDVLRDEVAQMNRTDSENFAPAISETDETPSLPVYIEERLETILTARPSSRTAPLTENRRPGALSVPPALPAALSLSEAEQIFAGGLVGSEFSTFITENAGAVSFLMPTHLEEITLAEIAIEFANRFEVNDTQTPLGRLNYLTYQAFQLAPPEWTLTRTASHLNLELHRAARAAENETTEPESNAEINARHIEPDQQNDLPPSPVEEPTNSARQGDEKPDTVESNQDTPRQNQLHGGTNFDELKRKTENAKRLPLEEVAQSLGLRRKFLKGEHVWEDDAQQFRIKFNGNLFCDRKDNYRGGQNAVNLVMHVTQKDFRQARDYLIENFLHNTPRPLPPNPGEKPNDSIGTGREETPAAPKILRMPPRITGGQLNQVRNYLTEERGLAPDVIDYLIERGHIYANSFGSCVFVHRDAEGRINGASWRATRGIKRGNAPGTDKANGWFYLGNLQQASTFIFTEAPIEALSYLQLHPGLDLEKTVIISAAGNAISAGLIRIVAAKGESARLIFAHNNDQGGEAGIYGALERLGRLSLRRHKAALSAGEIKITPFDGTYEIQLPRAGNDWNDEVLLLRERARNRVVAEDVRAEETAALEREAENIPALHGAHRKQELPPNENIKFDEAQLPQETLPSPAEPEGSLTSSIAVPSQAEKPAEVFRYLNFYTDPEHGWLEVDHRDCLELGIAGDISPYSPNTEESLFLEQDEDAPLFLGAAAAAGWWVETKAVEVEDFGRDVLGGEPEFNRNWADWQQATTSESAGISPEESRPKVEATNAPAARANDVKDASSTDSQAVIVGETVALSGNEYLVTDVAPNGGATILQTIEGGKIILPVAEEILEREGYRTTSETDRDLLASQPDQSVNRELDPLEAIEPWQLLLEQYVSQRLTEDMQKYERTAAICRQQLGEYSYRLSWNKVQKISDRLQQFDRIVAAPESYLSHMRASYTADYEALVTAAIGRGEKVPPEVVAQRPAFAETVAARKKFAAAWEAIGEAATSVTDRSLLSAFGVHVRTQSGIAPTPAQLAEIQTGLTELEARFGSLKDPLRGQEVVVIHTGGAKPLSVDRPEARQLNAGGDAPLTLNLGVCVPPDNAPLPTLAREYARLIDLLAGKAIGVKIPRIKGAAGRKSVESFLSSSPQAADQLRGSSPELSKREHLQDVNLISRAARNMLRPEEIKRGLSDDAHHPTDSPARSAQTQFRLTYPANWNDWSEIWGRLIEQYISRTAVEADPTGDERAAFYVSTRADYGTTPGYWDNAYFDRNLRPSVEREMRRRLELIRQALPAHNPAQEVNAAETISARAKTEDENNLLERSAELGATSQTKESFQASEIDPNIELNPAVLTLPHEVLRGVERNLEILQEIGIRLEDAREAALQEQAGLAEEITVSVWEAERDAAQNAWLELRDFLDAARSQGICGDEIINERGGWPPALIEQIAEFETERAASLEPVAETLTAPQILTEQRGTSTAEVTSVFVSQQGNPDLTRGFEILAEQVYAKLAAGESLGDNRAFTQLANAAYGKSFAAGGYTSKDAYDALEAGVNAWIIRHGKELLDDPDKQAALARLRAVSALLPTQTARTREQQLFQQFSTPPTESFVAYLACGVRNGETILEPSAGTGGLAAWARADGKRIVVNEISRRRSATLQLLGFNEIHRVDAQFLNDLLDGSVRPEIVLMNPPFSASGGRTRNNTRHGAEHLTDALARLKEGGRLVAVMGEGMALGRPAFHRWWVDILARYHVQANISVPGREYQKYGTNFGTQLIVIDKTGATPGNTTDERMKNVLSGTYADLETICNALLPIGTERRQNPALPTEINQRAEETPKVATWLTTDAALAPEIISAPTSEPLQVTAEGDAQIKPSTVSSPPTATEINALPEIPSVEIETNGANISEPAPSDFTSESETGTQIGVDSLPPTNQPESIAVETLTFAEEAVKREDAGGNTVRYRPAHLLTGVEHPAYIVESASMAAVTPPRITYQPQIEAEIIRAGKLSNIQLEAVIYAGQRHAQRLPDGARAGFFIGDGTGVGKGREIAGIALDNWNQGNRRILWMSVNYDLEPSAKRDLDALNVPAPLGRADDYSPDDHLSANFGDGVLFCSYSTFVAQSKKGRTRFAQITEWLGENGVVILDESHLAKNAVGVGLEKASQRGEKIVELQSGEQSNPDWKFVYVSATGATDVRHMGYMQRLGLWGPGTGFPGGFPDFQLSIERGGIGAMELAARDMKSLGMYCARTISYRGVNYRQIESALTPAQERIYDSAAEAWSYVRERFEEGLQITGANGRGRMLVNGRFWSSQQLFFRQLLTAMKVPSVIAETETALRQGSIYVNPDTGEEMKCATNVVIGIVGTGEARTKEQVARVLATGRSLDELDFSPKNILQNLIAESFPTQRYIEVADETGNIKRIPHVIDGKPVRNKEAEALRDRVLEETERLRLPDNPLDQIINYFGENRAAEITGRDKRLVRDAETGRNRYVKRAREGVSMDKASEDEMNAFQSGRKKIAIISQSASTGISLHSDLGTESANLRRIHITLETQWSADTQLQTFGRTHRSNQTFPPEYVLLSTNLGGEKRFLSTIARRLAGLGALTKGDRAQSGGGDLDKFDFENMWGEAAVKSVVMGMEKGRLVELDEYFGVGFSESSRGLLILERMGLARKGEDGRLEVSEETFKNLKVGQFLNRVLILDVKTQNEVFSAFTGTMNTIIENAKKLGQFDEGVQDIKGENIRRSRASQIVYEDPTTKAPTEYHRVLVDTPTEPVPFTVVENHLDTKKLFNAEIYGLYRHNVSGNLILTQYQGTRTDPQTQRQNAVFNYARPSGWKEDLLDESELKSKYTRIEPEEKVVVKERSITARELWEEERIKTPPFVTTEHHIIGGAVLPLWQRLAAREDGGGQMRLTSVRVNTNEGERIVGLRIPPRRINSVLKDLAVTSSYKTPDEIFTAVLDENQRVQLVGGLELQRTFLKSELVIKVANVSLNQTKEMETFGVREEFINFREVYFIPNDEEEGVKTLAKLLDRYPAVSDDAEATTLKEREEVSPDPNQATDAIQNEKTTLASGDLSSPDAHPDFVTSVTALKEKPIKLLAADIEAYSDRHSCVYLNPAAYEVVRRASGNTTKETEPAELSVAERPYGGIFRRPDKVARLLDNLAELQLQYPSAATELSALAEVIQQASVHGEGTVILLTNPAAKSHELLHRNSYFAGAGRELVERHDERLFAAMLESPQMAKARAGLTAKFGTAEPGFLVEELYVACGKKEGAEYALTREEEAAYLGLWFESIAVKNGLNSKEQFQEISDESANIRDAAYERAARQLVRERGVATNPNGAFDSEAPINNFPNNSAEQLGAEVTNHGLGRSVSAGRDSGSYRPAFRGEATDNGKVETERGAEDQTEHNLSKQIAESDRVGEVARLGELRQQAIETGLSKIRSPFTDALRASQVNQEQTEEEEIITDAVRFKHQAAEAKFQLTQKIRWQNYRRYPVQTDEAENRKVSLRQLVDEASVAATKNCVTKNKYVVETPAGTQTKQTQTSEEKQKQWLAAYEQELEHRAPLMEQIRAAVKFDLTNSRAEAAEAQLKARISAGLAEEIITRAEAEDRRSSVPTAALREDELRAFQIKAIRRHDWEGFAELETLSEQRTMGGSNQRPRGEKAAAQLRGEHKILAVETRLGKQAVERFETHAHLMRVAVSDDFKRSDYQSRFSVELEETPKEVPHPRTGETHTAAAERKLLSDEAESFDANPNENETTRVIPLPDERQRDSQATEEEDHKWSLSDVAKAMREVSKREQWERRSADWNLKRALNEPGNFMLRQLDRQINPFNAIEGELGFVLHPLETANNRLNPLQVMLNDEGIQAIRTVYQISASFREGHACHQRANALRDELAELEDKLLPEVNEQLSAERAALTKELSERENTLRVVNQALDREVANRSLQGLSLPDAALGTPQVANLGRAAVKLQDNALLDEFLDLAQAPRFASTFGKRLNDRLAGQVLLAEARALVGEAKVETLENPVGESGLTVRDTTRVRIAFNSEEDRAVSLHDAANSSEGVKEQVKEALTQYEAELVAEAGGARQFAEQARCMANELGVTEGAPLCLYSDEVAELSRINFRLNDSRLGDLLSQAADKMADLKPGGVIELKAPESLFLQPSPTLPPAVNNPAQAMEISELVETESAAALGINAAPISGSPGIGNIATLQPSADALCVNRMVASYNNCLKLMESGTELTLDPSVGEASIDEARSMTASSDMKLDKPSISEAAITELPAISDSTTYIEVGEAETITGEEIEAGVEEPIATLLL